MASSPPALVESAQLRADSWHESRAGMVRKQIEARGVRDPRVLAAMRAVQRARFVPQDVRRLAAADSALPIGHDQTISQPFIVAYMTELLQIEKQHRVLEIGTGSGYQSAILAELSDHVYSVEIVPALAARAAQTLRELGYSAVSVKQRDGYRGWPDHAPYDRVIVTAAPPEVPDALVDELAPGGRLVAPVGRHPSLQRLVVITKDRKGRMRQHKRLAVRFVPMVQSDRPN